MILCPITKECNCSCPRVLGLRLRPGVLELRNETRWQSCVGKLPQCGFCLLHHAELGGLFAESTHLSCSMPVCQSLLFLPGEGQKCPVYLLTLLLAEEFSMTLTLGLPDKTHAYSDMRLWSGAPAGGRVLSSLLMLCVTGS